MLINLVSYKKEPAVFAQYSGGYKIWIPDPEVLEVYKICYGIDTVSSFNDDWFVCAGPLLPGSPLPYPCDAYGRRKT